jgi:hypothetical protein
MRSNILPAETARQVIGVRLDQPTIAQLQRIAADDSRSLAGTIRVAVIDWLARRQQPGAIA